jgi:two-component system chemotaxis response regulator CheY
MKEGTVLNSINVEIIVPVDPNAPSRLCLITDDSPLVRRIARKALTKMGFEIDEAENGQVALDKCRVRMPDVVLLDWNMPVMDGFNALVKIKNDFRFSSIPIIMLTSESDDKKVKMAHDAGASGYVKKPFTQDELLENIKQVINEP